MEFVINWMMPAVVGFITLMAAMEFGRIHERVKHECPPCGRKHRDEL